MVDWKADSQTRFWLSEELQHRGQETLLLGFDAYDPADETSRFGMIRLWGRYLGLAIKGIKATRKGDTIIHWNFVAGAMGAFLCRVFFIKRKLIALNMIAHRKGFLNAVLRKLVYNTAFGNKNLRVSVNDEQLAAQYAQQFRFPVNRMFVLHDAYDDNYKQAAYSETGGYVFTGGDAFRDWEGLIRCAEELPAMQFIGVARKKNFPEGKKWPENLRMYFDTPQAQFYELLENSRIVFLPLNSTAPCGLIVMIRAALLSKPVIITHTPSTRNYVEEGVSGRLTRINDIADMKRALTELDTSPEQRRQFALNLKEHITRNFSTRNNAAIIDRVIREQRSNTVKP